MPGWFFLDSVDEARLARKHFHVALQKFARELGDALQRAHVYISCRISDWKGEEDRLLADRLLPYIEPVARQEETDPSADPLLDPIFVEKRSRAPTPKGDEKALTIVQLVALSPPQYSQLAEAAGITDIDAFTGAIQDQGLDALTERPGDLLDLAEYWREHRHFGSLAEMVEHGIVRKLREGQADRPDNDVLSQTEARNGACRIAAALTFGKAFTLKTPHHDPDHALAAGALDIDDVMPEWTVAKRAALLRRAIFAPATYGRVRFHHRSTQEYLAADWLDRLLHANCPIAEVWNLIFAERYGVKTVVPSLLSVAAWLAHRRSDICQEIIRREPLVLINFGDAGSLSIAVREALLDAYATKHAVAEIADDQTDRRSLMIFADQRLAPAITRAWNINPRADFHSDMLRLIREGRITGCADLARRVALDGKASRHQRALALDALAACDPDDPALATAARRLVRAAARIDSRVAASFALILYPRHLTTAQLLTLISKSTPPPKRSTDGFGYSIRQLYNACPTPDDKNTFCARLADLCLAPPFVGPHQRVSVAFKWLARHLHEIAVAEVRRRGTQPPDQGLIRLCMVTERVERYPSLDEDNENLAALVRRNPALYRALFWADIEEHRQQGPSNHQLTRYWQIYLGGHTLWEFTADDIEWLLDELTARPLELDKQIVLSAMFFVLRSDEARRDVVIDRIRAGIGSSAALQNDLRSYLSPPLVDPALVEQEQHMRELERERKESEEKAKASWRTYGDMLRANPTMLSDPAQLMSWKAGSWSTSTSS